MLSVAETTRIRDAGASDLDAVERLLTANDLTLAGLREAFASFVVAESDNRIVGSAGLELFGDAALLRSAAVATEKRGTGLGTRLVERAIEKAAQLGAREVILLTTSAPEYFTRFGFQRITRDDVPASVRSSVEFTAACCATATIMRLTLRAQQ